MPHYTNPRQSLPRVQAALLFFLELQCGRSTEVAALSVPLANYRPSRWVEGSTLLPCLLLLSTAPARIAFRHTRLIGSKTGFRGDPQRHAMPAHRALQARLRGQALQFAQRAGELLQRQPALP